MNKTKIEWTDYTWNPVTGCLHGCVYCYARSIARRFGGAVWEDWSVSENGRECNACGEYEASGELHVLDEPFFKDNGMIAPYPFYFDPTLHRYRLNNPLKKKPGPVFVCSMADLFGNWVPDTWIEFVFDACRKAPQHKYLFLTKNPARYAPLSDAGLLPREDNFWYGTTVNTQADADRRLADLPNRANKFISVEPMMERISLTETVDWVIAGIESGNRKGRAVPNREWILDLMRQCRTLGIPFFMKNSLVKIWGEPLIQEYPKGL